MQNIDLSYASQLKTDAINNKFLDLFGRSGVFKGFEIVPDSLLDVNIERNGDDDNRMNISGASIDESTDVVDSISIPANSSGSNRTDYIYAYYEHGVDNTVTYKIVSSTITDDSRFICLLATIIVPTGTATITSAMITNATKIKSLSEMSPDVITLLTQMTTTVVHNDQENTLANHLTLGKSATLKKVRQNDSVVEVIDNDGIVSLAGYNDGAELFKPAEGYEFPVGTLCKFTDDGISIMPTDVECDPAVVGVVSNTFGWILGDKREEYIPIGICGRVRVKAVGPIKKFDQLTASNISGTAKRAYEIVPGTSFGKALEDVPESSTKEILVLIMLG